DMRQAIDGQTEPLKHVAFHMGAGGRVEIWPLYTNTKQDREITEEGWQNPAQMDSGTSVLSMRQQLYSDMVQRIKGLIADQPFLATKADFLLPGDILVLCRTGKQVDMFIQALSEQGITATRNADIILEEHPAVADILAVLRFLANMNDNV